MLKKTVRGLIPDELIDRKKQGFGVPVYEWFFDRLGIRVTEIPKENNHGTIVSEKISCGFQDKI